MSAPIVDFDSNGHCKTTAMDEPRCHGSAFPGVDVKLSDKTRER